MEKSAENPFVLRKIGLWLVVENGYKPITTDSFKQFRQGFQQESILLHRGNVENYVESVENPVEYRGKTKNRVMLRVKFSVEKVGKPARKPDFRW